MVAAVDDASRRVAPRSLKCSDEDGIVEFFRAHRPFRAVIEASGTYRWLHDLLSAEGEVVLAHPLRLRAIWSGRAKTDDLDDRSGQRRCPDDAAKALADLLRADLIPESYVPPEEYQALRDLTRARARLVRQRTRAANGILHLLGRHNIEPRYRKVFGPRGLRWVEGLGLPFASAFARDEFVERVRHCDRAIARADAELSKLAERFPETEALTTIHGIGLYSALLIAGEIARPERFRTARQVGAYAGLTPRVTQSGATERRGAISKQGSAWLRWILVQTAIKVVRCDDALRNFYTRVRRRAGVRRARVGVARKLAEICWRRLRAWHAARA